MSALNNGCAIVACDDKSVGWTEVVNLSALLDSLKAGTGMPKPLSINICQLHLDLFGEPR